MRTFRPTERKDLLMVSISIFAIIGSAIVFRSFAATKYKTTAPGTIPLSKLAIEQSNNAMTIGFENNPNLTYCTNNKHVVYLPDDSIAIASFDNTHKQYCSQNQQKTKLKLTTKNSDNEKLYIYAKQ